MSTSNKNGGQFQPGHEPLGRVFQKGDKRGRGRPKTAKCIPDILRRIGDEPVSPVMLARLRAKWGPDFRPKNNHEAMLMVAYAQAHEGDAVARAFVAERTEGKVLDRIEFDDVTPREVVFREVRVGDVATTTVSTRRIIPRPTPTDA